MRSSHSVSVAILIGLAVVACKPSLSPGNGSQVKYGFLGGQDFHLISIASGAQIKFCGPHFDHYQWAIGVWGEALGRIYDVVQSCDSPHVQSFTAPADVDAVTACTKANFTNRMFSYPSEQPMQVFDCYKEADRVQRSILHETGHLFGLCDQYEQSLSHCSATTMPVPGSVMNAADTLYLLPDDIRGILALADLYPLPDAPPAPFLLPAGNYGASSTGLVTLAQTPTTAPMTALAVTTESGTINYDCTKDKTCKSADGRIIKPIGGHGFIYCDSSDKCGIPGKPDQLFRLRR